MPDDFLPQRLARPGETLEYADNLGTLHTIEVDDDGKVQPSNATEDNLLAQRGYPRIEADPDGPNRPELQERARELDLPASGTKAELTAVIAAEEQRRAEASSVPLPLEPVGSEAAVPPQSSPEDASLEGTDA